MEKKRKNQNHFREQNQLKEYAKYSGLAIQMAVTIYLGNVLGQYLDSHIFYREDEVWTKGCTLIAVFLSIFLIIRQVSKNK